MKNHENRNSYVLAIAFFFICCLLIGGLAISARGQTASVQVQFDYGGESDVAGFHLFYSTVAGGPYAVGYNMPIQDYQPPPAWMSVPLSLEPGTYHFVATAYDSANNESGYSNEATLTVNNTVPPAGCTGLKVRIPQ